MKRMTQILSLGLLLSISSVALAGQSNDRNNNRQYSKHGHHNRHYAKNNRYARRHSHQGRYCYDWHPRGYVAPRMRYGYLSPGLVIVYHPNAGIYIGGGH